MHLVALSGEYFDARFGFFQLFAARLAEAGSLFKQLESALERQIAALQFLDDQLQLLEAGLEAGDGFFFLGHQHILAWQCHEVARPREPADRWKALSKRRKAKKAEGREKNK